MSNFSLEEGYHQSWIPKGTYGEFSKIREEYFELEDSINQDAKIMTLNELSDLYGAIEAFAENLGFSMDDIKKMSDLTKKAFLSGKRS